MFVYRAHADPALGDEFPPASGARRREFHLDLLSEPADQQLITGFIIAGVAYRTCRTISGWRA